MNKESFIKYLVITLPILVVFSSCKHKENEYHSLMDKIEAKSINYHADSIIYANDWGDIKTIEITEGVHTFLIPERKSQIKSYTCTECHTMPLEKLTNKDLSKKAHWDIRLNHANESVMNCVTCHNAGDINTLKSLTGKKIDLNKSYKLCSQCHSNQFEDWKGGAHGKNIGGWTNPRVAMTCVNCHNPHKPQIPSKWPSRFNTKTASDRK